jgi:predicted nucleic acid-binding protein
MIFLDTNFILRFLTPPATSMDEDRRATARALFAAVARGEEDVTTSEVVLHEVAYILASKRHYNLSASEVVAYLSPFLGMPGLKLPRGEKAIYLRALDIYTANPKLEYADSINAARAERLGASLATFDKELGRLDFITKWEPPRLPND